ncbi:hypothetical protein D3C76_142690 [compost metagenome]
MSACPVNDCRQQTAWRVNNERNIEHIRIAVLMPEHLLHQSLLIVPQRIHRHPLVIPVEHNQAVIPQSAGLQLLQKLPHRIVCIILSLNIVAQQCPLVALRKLHLELLLRNTERMMGAHGNDHRIERLVLGIKCGQLRYRFGEQHLIRRAERDMVIITKERLIIVFVKPYRFV